MSDSFDLRLLDPKGVRVFRAGGVLRLETADRCWVRLRVMRAFPISDLDHYYALLDGDGHDIGVIAEPADLDAQSRELADEDLESRYFVPVVQQVNDVREDYGAVLWDVETDRGPRHYVVRAMRDNLVELASGRMHITDIDGNRFEIRDLQRLSPAAQTIILKNL